MTTSHSFIVKVSAVFGVLLLALGTLVGVNLINQSNHNQEQMAFSRPLILNNGVITAGRPGSESAVYTNPDAVDFTVVGRRWIVVQLGTDKLTVYDIETGEESPVDVTGLQDIHSLQAADAISYGFLASDTAGTQHLYLYGAETGQGEPLMNTLNNEAISPSQWLTLPPNEVLAYLDEDGQAWLYDLRFKNTFFGGTYSQLGGFVTIGVDAQLWGKLDSDPGAIQAYSTGGDSQGVIKPPAGQQGELSQLFSAPVTSGDNVWLYQDGDSVNFYFTESSNANSSATFAGELRGKASSTSTGSVIAVPVEVDGTNQIVFIDTESGTILSTTPGDAVFLVG